MQEKLYLHRKEDLWKIYHQHQQRYFSTQREWFTKLDIAEVSALSLVQCYPPQANRVESMPGASQMRMQSRQRV